MTKTHCQICERDILANNKAGVIAHHGYQRPDRGSGWQTASCWGARHLPYEKSCDQIQPCIDHIEAYIYAQEQMVKHLMENPPETMRDDGYMYTPIEKRPVFNKPADFDAKANLERGAWGRGYEYLHAKQVLDHKRNAKQSRKDVERLKKRLADWKPAVQ